MKNSHEDYPLNYRHLELSFEEAYELVWGAGNHALRLQSRFNDDIRQEISSHIGYLFNLLGQLRIDNGGKSISYGQIIGPYEQEIDRFEKSSPDYDFVDGSEYIEGLMAIELCLNLSLSELTPKRKYF